MDIDKVWLLSNAYDRDLSIEDERIKEIMKWRFRGETESAFEEIGVPKEKIQPPLIASRQQTYQLVSPEGLTLPYTKMVAKGCSVRNNLFTLINSYKLGDNDVVVYFDGDGQVDFNHVVEIVKGLKENELILSKRVGNPGISDGRVLVEKFENSFVEDEFSIVLPDAQCGCWGLRGKLLKAIYGLLSAEGFEIELDILICSLKKGVKPCFVDIELNSTGTIDTTYVATEDDLTKLHYLMKIFGADQVGLLEKSQVFAKQQEPLPQEYTKLFTYDKIKRLGSTTPGEPLPKNRTFKS